MRQWIKVYQSKALFGTSSGIRYYGEVKSCTKLRRRDINYIPRNSDEWYYLLEIKEWKILSKSIAIKERGMGRKFTNMFLLEHSSEAPELSIRTEAEYRLFSELKRTLNSTEINDEGSEIGFVFGDITISFEGGEIRAKQNEQSFENLIDIQTFSRAPNTGFRIMRNKLLSRGWFIDLNDESH